MAQDAPKTVPWILLLFQLRYMSHSSDLLHLRHDVANHVADQTCYLFKE